jgi:hypothetical protein
MAEFTFSQKTVKTNMYGKKYTSNWGSIIHVEGTYTFGDGALAVQVNRNASVHDITPRVVKGVNLYDFFHGRQVESIYWIDLVDYLNKEESPMYGELNSFVKSNEEED